MIEQFLAELEKSSSSLLVTRLGKVYRAHYRCRCKGMTWQISLPILQLAAVCLGPRILTGLCRALAMNFKFFSSGAPDLLVMRLRSSTSAPGTLAISDVLGEDWQSTVDPGALTRHDEEEEQLRQPVIKRQRRRSALSSPGDDEALSEDREEVREISLSPAKERAFDCPCAEDVCLPPLLEAESMLVEVKGPTDHLSRQQTSWLRLLAGHGAKAFVCRVREEEPGRQRSK